MYEFIDIDDYQEAYYSSIQTICDDINLDKEVPGFKTLTVSGRGLVGRDIDTLKFVARGYKDKVANRTRDTKNAYVNQFIASSIQGITVTVKYRLTAPTNEEFRKRLSYLSYRLQKEQVQWIWTDEPDYYYVGTVTDYGVPDEDTNSIVSEFKIFMTDPRKVTLTPLLFEGTMTKKKEIKLYKREEMYEIRSMKIVPKMNADKLVITNETQNLYIRLDGQVNPTDVYTYKPGETLLRNGENAMPRVHLLSNLEDFNLQEGDKLSFNIPVDFQIEIISKGY